MSHRLQQQIISGAAQLIADRRNWTQHSARRLVGDTMRYCAFGALTKAAFDVVRDHEAAMRLVISAEAEIALANGWTGGSRLSRYNDTHSHAHVIRALRRTLAKR